MKKKISVLLTVIALLLTFSSCNGDSEHKTGWQNPDENQSVSNDETTTEQTDSDTDNNKNTDTAKVVFSESIAQDVGSFNSEIYGKLHVYFQNGYFLLLDEYGDTKFTVFAENFSTKDTNGQFLALFNDMNFDNKTDFAVCYYKDALNSYYYCFLWNETEKTFSYYLPLSNLSNPEFDSKNTQITSKYRFTATQTREDIYKYDSGELKLVHTYTSQNTQTDTGPEIIDSKLQITENVNSAQISIASKKGARSKWVCKIDNENVVTLSSEYYDEYTYTYEFLLSSLSVGTTTVVFRYETVDTHAYVEERVINVSVDENRNIKVILPTQEP